MYENLLAQYIGTIIDYLAFLKWTLEFQFAPVYIPIIAKDQFAALICPECLEGYAKLAPKGADTPNKVAARVFMTLPFWFPGHSADKIEAPTLIIAAENAKFGQPEIKVGIVPGAGGVSRLMRRIGRPRAMRLVLTGELISGRQAFDWGLVSAVEPDGDVLSKAIAMASAIAALPAASATAIKATADFGDGAPLADALAFERRAFLALFGTPDQREGAAAFLEKRKPQFGAKSGSDND